MCGVYPASATTGAGEEISSTYEGRHVTLRDDELEHPYSGASEDGFVDKGDPVIMAKAGNGIRGQAVGVALASASAVSDLIAVDTEGIFKLMCYADNDAGGSEIVPGDALFISDDSTGSTCNAGVGSCCISKIRNLVTQRPFGYALGNIASEGEGVIAVKVHWDPEEQQDEYITFADGHGTDDGKSFNIADADTSRTSGYSNGLKVNYVATGDLTVTAERIGFAVDMTLTDADTPYAYLNSHYLVTTGDPAIGLAAGITIYIDNLGTACGQLHIADLQYGSTNAPTGLCYYERHRNHSDNTPTACLFLQANNGAAVATYFIDTGLNNETAPVAAAANTGTDYTPTYKIACRYGATVFYLTGVAEA